MKRRKEIDREVVGLKIHNGRLNGMPSCHLLYRVQWSDGSMTIHHGRQVYSAPHIGDLERLKKRKKVLGYRPDLEAAIKAASILNEALTSACLFVDAGGKL